MAALTVSALFPKWKEKLLTMDDAIDFNTATIKARLTTSADAPDDTDDFISDVTKYPGTTDQTVAFSSATNGAFKSSSPTITFSTVTPDGSNTATGVVLFSDTGGAESTDPVICWIKFGSPVTPNGGNITVTWDTSPDYIFQI
jgi:hypothetical protein